MNRPIGLIAGGGLLPKLQARGIRDAGHPVACVGLAGQHDNDLPDLCDRFARVGVLRPGSWIKRLRRWGVDQAVLVGTVDKAAFMYHAKFYSPSFVLQQLPDRRVLWLWYRVLRHDRRSQRGLGALADLLARGGVELIDTTRYIPEHLAATGVNGAVQPPASARADIDFGWPLLMKLNELDIGQALAVKGGDVIAVEAAEGTARLITRAGELCPRGGWTLLKGAPPEKDRRFDVPFIGLQTVEQMQAAGCRCLAVAAGRVILAERDKLLPACDAAGIAVVGVE